jgi:hypothetical protein
MAATEVRSLMRSAKALPLAKNKLKKIASQDFMMFFMKIQVQKTREEMGED